ncbi:MAG TPA: amidohydrolase family protein [Blastocatellia bacterium]|nr:amidohydrolase family protein [Blastocatellia bacterium]
MKPAKRPFAFCLLPFAFCLLALPIFSQSKYDPAAVYAIRNARIVTVTGATIEKGTVLVRDGKIAAVGEQVSVPGNAKVIDGTGLSVYPGLIDSGTILGLSEVGAVNATLDTTELGEFNSNMKALTAVNPNSELIPVARSNGVTTVLTCPLGGVISGQCALINIDGWTPQEMALRAPAAMRLIYPTAGGGGRGGGFFRGVFGQSPEALRQQRDKRVEELRKKLDDAIAYARAKEAAAKDKSIPAHPTDLGLEALIPVVKGEVPVLVTASRQGEIKSAIELADKYKLRIIIFGGEEAIKVAPLLKEKNIPVLIGPILDLPDNEDDPYDIAYARAGELNKAGVKIAIMTNGEPANIRLLPYHAGTAAAFGLPKEEALKAVTIYPAQIFGVDKLVGSIEVGKVANLIVTDGDPLEYRTKLKYMFVNGHQTDLMNKHIRLYEKFKDRP